MRYFRFYDDVMDDPKLMTLPAETYRFWTVLLCMASRSPVRGTLPPEQEISFRSRVPIDDVRAHLATLLKVKLVEKGPKGTFTIYKWDTYQPAWDDPRERMRKSRERKRNSVPGKEVADPESDATTTQFDTATVTSPVTSRETQQLPLDEMRSEEKEKKNAGEPESDLPENAELDGPIGVNSAAKVRETLWAAEEMWPMSSIRIQSRQWLADHPAAKVIAAMTRAHDRKMQDPASYIKTVLADPEFGKPKPQGPRRAPPKPEPLRPENKPVEVPPGWAEHHAKMFGPKAKGKN